MKSDFDAESSPPMFPINPSIPLLKEIERCPKKWDKVMETHAQGVRGSRRKLTGEKVQIVLNLITATVVILIILTCGYLSYFPVEISLFKERYS